MLVVKTTHNGLRLTPINRFDTIIDNCTVSIGSRDDELEICIRTNKSERVTLNLFFELFSLLFLYLGSFPIINEISFNGRNIDYSDWVNKYRSDSKLFRRDFVIVDITSNTINQTIIDKFRNMQKEAVYSLQYLVSEGYKNVIITHRLTLLSHIIDGVYDLKKSQSDALINEATKKYGIAPSNLPGKYFAKVYSMSKKYFFYYHRKYNCEILKLLNITYFNFLNMITDTRNWYSHFLHTNKPYRIKDGDKQMFFFMIIYYMIRLHLVESLNVQIKEEYIREYYYIIHDWIRDVLNKTDNGYKSELYKNIKKRDEIFAKFQYYIEVQP